MSTVYVALDLETTGLDPRSDAIIEVGAIRFEVGGVSDRFSTLVNPRRPIPSRIQALTGITDDDVQAAPPLEAIAPQLEAFLGDAILVGHNVTGFDLRFLGAAGLRHGGTAYDTRELAALLLPGLPGYGLAALAQRFGIPFAVQHRALADAEATRQLFVALWEQALRLPGDVLRRVAEWLALTSWPGRGFFQEVWGAAQATGLSSVPGFRPRVPPIADALAPDPSRQPIPENRPLAVLAAARQRPEALPQFEERAEQQAMMRAVTRALNEGQRLLVEAGTGTGKSLAYLIPAACEALANGRRVVVSTATINLQEQLMRKDLPALSSLLPKGAPALRACQLKGRRNYLCLRRFAALEAAPPSSDEEALLAARILIWLTQTETGDREELHLSPGEEAVWRRFSAEGAGCTADNSPFVVEGYCFLQRARRRAEASHLVVVNHALLLSDIATGGHVLPPYQHLIVDEAHHLEDEGTRQFGFRCREGEVADILQDCQALGPALQGALRAATAALGPGAQLRGLSEALRQSADRARARLQELSQQLQAFFRHHATQEQEPSLLIDRSMRVQLDWADVEIAWENLRLSLHEVLSFTEHLRNALEEGVGLGLLNGEVLAAEATDLLQRGQALADGMAVALTEDDPQRVVWLERDRGDGGLIIAWAPLRVDAVLRQRLYADRDSVILTGATLTSGGSFDYLRERLGLAEAEVLALGSPFDYRHAALVLVPEDMPEPTWPDYLEALARAVVDLAGASEGRALILFTSHATLQAVHALVREVLQGKGIEVMAQGVDGSPRHLIRVLQSNPRSVVLGTASFWEGVDVAGEALSLLVMARLPFVVPTEPVFAARSASYDNPFTQYALPQAVLRFRQGFGRLIRAKTDRGVLAVLDRRIVSKSYGAAFLDSLPGCPVREVRLREMPDLVQQWLGTGGGLQQGPLSTTGGPRAS